MSVSRLKRSFNLAGIWPVSLAIFNVLTSGKTEALPTKTTLLWGTLSLPGPLPQWKHGGNWEDEVFRHARHFHALSVARTAVLGNRNHNGNHHQSSVSESAFGSAPRTDPAPACGGCGSRCPAGTRPSLRLQSVSQLFHGPTPRSPLHRLASSSPCFVVLPGSRVKESFRPVGESDSSTCIWPASAQSAAWVGSHRSSSAIHLRRHEDVSSVQG